MTCSVHRAAVLFALAALLPAAAPAQVDFTKYVAIGDSLTAGYASGGLVADNQQHSYPALLADRFGSQQPFEQPWISDPGIPTLLVLKSLVPDVVLDQDHDGDGTDDAPGQPFNLFLPRPYDNLGIPGAAARHMVRVYPPGHPDRPFFYDLVIRGDLIADGTEDTVLEQAAALQPTFVSIWIGANDVLGAALSGCDDTISQINPAWFCPLTGVWDAASQSVIVDEFGPDFDTLVDGIAGTGAKLAIANIPDVTAIPFVQFMPETVLDASGNELTLVSWDAPAGPQPVTSFDFVLPAARCYLAQGCGFGAPPTLLGFPSDVIQGCEGPPGAADPFTWNCSGGYMPTNAVLRAIEAKNIAKHLAVINDDIEAKAAAVGAALVDANGFFEQVATEGLDIGGIGYSASFLSGGLFSYDGVHPTNLGYALIANLFIEAINDHYGTDVPPVDLYPYVFGGLSPGPTPPPPPTASVTLPGNVLGLLAGKSVALEAPAVRRAIDRQQRLQRLRLDRAAPARQQRPGREATGRVERRLRR